MPTILVSVLLAALLGSGISVGASSAKPGDVLYGFKVGVNERLEDTLAASDAAKVELHLASMQQRLLEAQELAQAGTLTAGAQAALNANFSMHAAALAAAVQDLSAKGKQVEAAALAARYDATLTAQALQLNDLATKTSVSSGQSPLTSLLEQVQAARNSASALTAAASAKAAVVQ